MTDLIERHDVGCPYHLAQRFLAEGLGDRAASGLPMVVNLGAGLLGAEMSKNVVVHFGVGTDPMHFDRPYRVHWTPEGGGPYPDFDGELTVRAGEDYTASVLELRGQYRPPGGAAGEAFDLLVGKRIASGTARRLLEEIGAQMETRYREQEAAKR